MSKFYSGVKKLLGGLIRRLYRVRIIGAENEPTDGAFIVCSNHLSNHDVLILFSSLKRQLRFLAKAELFKVPLLKQFVSALGAYPIKRGSSDLAALKKTISLLNDGQVVGFFPQGHRFPGVHPVETEVQSGVGLVTAKAKARVLPVLIETKGFKVKMFRKTVVRIGKPIEFEHYGELQGNKNDYVTISQSIFKSICAMSEQQCVLTDGKQNSETEKDEKIS